MRILWKLGLGVLVVFVAAGCAHRTATENVTSPSPVEIRLYEIVVKQVMYYTRGKGVVSVIVLANKENDEQLLPISVGMSEGLSIDRALNKRVVKRPGTHDLFASVLGKFHMKLIKVVITDLREDTYIAAMTVDLHGRAKELDARPSDAIALALRCSAPVFVSEEVIRKGGWTRMEEPEQDEEQEEIQDRDNVL